MSCYTHDLIPSTDLEVPGNDSKTKFMSATLLAFDLCKNMAK
jgi:hypothetical protein